MDRVFRSLPSRVSFGLNKHTVEPIDSVLIRETGKKHSKKCVPDAVEETFGPNHAAAGRFRPDLLRKLPPRTLPAHFYFQLVSISLLVFLSVVLLD